MSSLVGNRRAGCGIAQRIQAGTVNKHLSRRTFIAAGLGAGAAALARWDTNPDAVLYNGAILTMMVAIAVAPA